MVLGIVGKIGSGKSAVVKYLQEEYGAIAFSCDDVAKEIMKEEDYNISGNDEIFTNKNFLEKVRIELHPKVFYRIFENILILYNFIAQNEYNSEKNEDILSVLEKKYNINIFSNLLNENNFLNFIEQSNRFSKEKSYTKLNNENYLNSLRENNFMNKNHKNNEKQDIKTENECALRILENFKNFNEFYNILIIIESALPSDDMFKICDNMIYIDSPYKDRVNRLKETRDYSEEKIKLIYDSQAYYEKFYDRADYKIMNDGTKEALVNKVKEVMDEIYIASK